MGFEHACEVLRRSRQCEDGAGHIDYPAPATCELFFHNVVWPLLIQAIPDFAKDYVEDYLSCRPDSEFTLIKPSIGHPRPCLRPEFQMNWAIML